MLGERREKGKKEGKVEMMPRRAFISLVLKVSGNVNADAGIGTRIPIKKIITWDQKIKPFVSARCIRRCLRERLYEKGFEIDPLQMIGPQGREQLGDIGNPVRYIDDDLFGFLVPREPPVKRSSPVKISHLISLTHTEIKVEFAGRFPRDFLRQFAPGHPVPFEIEVAEWLGKLNVIITDRIGVFRDDELTEEAKKLLASQRSTLTIDERRSRLRALLEVLLWEGWTFPRAAQGPSVPEYYYGVLALTDRFIPLPGYVSITEDGQLDEKLINNLYNLYKPLLHKLYVLDYRASVYKKLMQEQETLNTLNANSIEEIINEVCNYIIAQ